MRRSVASFRPIDGPSPMSKQKMAGSAPVCRQTRSAIFDDGDGGERRFLRRFPNRGVAADRGKRRVPRPNRDRKIESGNDSDQTERMPLLHQAMVLSLRLDREAVEHPRLADGEIADVDHLLHFAFAFRDDLAGLEGNELRQGRISSRATRCRAAGRFRRGPARAWCARSRKLFARA